jgi:hypothetical protein
MIEQRTIYKCDLCHEEERVERIYRVQHLVNNEDLRNVVPAGIELYGVRETLAFSQASQTCICFSCCETVFATVGRNVEWHGKR